MQVGARKMKDFFISYNKADRSWAEWIAWQVEEIGYSVILQAWDFGPGSNFVVEMQKASTETERTIAVLSPDYLAAEFTAAEWSAAFAKDPTGEKRLLLPVRVREYEPRGLLHQIVYIDLVNIDESTAKELLHAGINLNRAKPILKPKYPRTIMNQPSYPTTSGKLRLHIDTNQIKQPPELPFLFRKKILRKLDHYLSSDKVSVVGITADGGVGKTALVWEWIKKVESNYEKLGITDIFAYSFYDRAKGSTADTSTQFFDDSFAFFLGRYTPESGEINQPHDRALYLFNRLPARSILIIDGIESLQSLSGNLRGEIPLDEAMRDFLESAAREQDSQKNRLIAITSRVPLTDLENKRNGYRSIALNNLEPNEGAALLREIGVKSTEDELNTDEQKEKQMELASKDMDGHCLSLILLGKLIVSHFHKDPDIKYRHEIFEISKEEKEGEEEEEYQKHAHRIMRYYDDIVAKPSDMVVLQMMGLFHSAMTMEQQNALTKAEFARGFKPNRWAAIAQKLQKYGLMTVINIDGEEIWNCHPLVREHYRDKLKEDDKKWVNANQILMKFFENFFHNPVRLPQNRDEFVHFYRAIHHGCLAGQFTEALRIYDKYIIRDRGEGYSTNECGLAADDVAALDRFFKPPEFLEPIDTNITAGDLDFLWGRKAFCLTCLGLLDEAIKNREQERDFFIKRTGDQQTVVLACEQLSAIHVMRGNLSMARESAEQSVNFSSFHACGEGERERTLCRLGAVFYLTNQLKECGKVFDEAKSYAINRPLISDYGIYYRLYKLDIAETDDDYLEIQRDAIAAWRYDQKWLVPRALDLVMQAIATYRMQNGKDAEKKAVVIELFKKALQDLSKSGSVVYLPHYYLAEAKFNIDVRQNFNLAQDSLTNARRIAVSHGMRLFSIDCNLLQTRIFLGMENSEAARASIRKASEQLGILPCYYCLRDTDIALLEAELAVAEKNTKAEGLLNQAKELINNSGRKMLGKRLKIAREKL